MFSKAKTDKTQEASGGKAQKGALADAPTPLASNQSNPKKSAAARIAKVPSIISADVSMRGNVNSA
ncbi:MAG: hypothetical protein AAGA09_06345, partial [Pseudomonadota bacterium]